MMFRKSINLTTYRIGRVFHCATMATTSNYSFLDRARMTCRVINYPNYTHVEATAVPGCVPFIGVNTTPQEKLASLTALRQLMGTLTNYGFLMLGMPANALFFSDSTRTRVMPLLFSALYTNDDVVHRDMLNQYTLYRYPNSFLNLQQHSAINWL
jgi:hypothetical protein